MRRGGQLATKFRNKVIAAARKSEPVSYNPPGDPPTVKVSPSTVRWVRVYPVPGNSQLSANDISIKDSFDYTGGSAPRYRQVKPLRARFYAAGPGYFKVNYTSSNSSTALTLFEDYGNGMMRSKVGIIIPSLQRIEAANSTTALFSWVSDSPPEVIDVLTEFS